MFHFQGLTDGWIDAIRKLPAGSTVKAVMRPDILEVAKANNPKVFTVLRHWDDSLQHYDGNLSYDVWVNKARHWFSTHVDGTFEARYADGAVDAVSWHNEIWAESQNDHERQERIVATKAAINVWNDEYRPRFAHDITLVVGEAAVGNSMPAEIAKLAYENDCLLGYHPYMAFGAFGAPPKQRWAEDWRWLSGRWAYMDEEYRAVGAYPTWIFTEAGPFQSVMDGWRSSKCLGADANLYVDAIRTWIREIKQTVPYQEGRVKGFHLFTTGGGQKWNEYETRQPEMSRLADMIAVEWTPAVKPPDPPDPKPEFAFNEYPVFNVKPYVTQPFNNPTSYGRHEGIDLRVTQDGRTDPPIIAGVDGGIVEHVRTTDPGTGYGKYVRVRFDGYEGAVYKLYYCHLSAVAVKAGDTVNAETKIGNAGSTGNSTGPHLHLNVVKIPGGHSGYVIDNVVDPYHYIAKFFTPDPPDPPTPPPCPKVDYKVIVHLLPQDTTLAELREATEYAWHAGKQSVVYSADDAARLACAGKAGSNVVVWDPERWDPNDPPSRFVIVEWLLAKGVPTVYLKHFSATEPPPPPPLGDKDNGD